MAFSVIYMVKDKTVVAYMEDPIGELYKEFREFTRGTDIRIFSFDKFENKYGKQIKAIRGIARCNVKAGDVFDIEIGEKIATQKYLKIFESYRILMYEMILEDMDALCAKAAKRMLNGAYRRKRRSDKINDLASGKIKE